MNAVRIRKENQVYSTEAKRALSLFNYEEKVCCAASSPLPTNAEQSCEWISPHSITAMAIGPCRK